MLTGHEVFRLQFFTGARREAHPEVWQAFKPRARHAHLLRTVLGGKFGDGVQIPGSTLGPEEFRSCVKRLSFFIAALDPDFTDALVLPVGKKANAIRL